MNTQNVEVIKFQNENDGTAATDPRAVGRSLLMELGLGSVDKVEKILDLLEANLCRVPQVVLTENAHKVQGVLEMQALLYDYIETKTVMFGYRNTPIRLKDVLGVARALWKIFTPGGEAENILDLTSDDDKIILATARDRIRRFIVDPFYTIMVQASYELDQIILPHMRIDHSMIYAFWGGEWDKPCEGIFDIQVMARASQVHTFARRDGSSSDTGYELHVVYGNGHVQQAIISWHLLFDPDNDIPWTKTYYHICLKKTALETFYAFKGYTYLCFI